MADDETVYLLETWGLGHLKEHFRDNMIDVATLRLLNDEDIRHLVSPMGTMIKFRENWKIWLANLNSADPGANAIESLDDSYLLDISNRIASAISSESRPSTSSAQVSLIPEATCPQELPLAPSTTDVQSSFRPISLSAGLLDQNFVEDCLNETVDGRGLLAVGRQSKNLTESQRRELGRLLIAKLLFCDPDRRISSSEFIKIALQVVQLFPKEAVSLYFNASLCATKYTSKRNASGILYEAYLRRRRKLRELGQLPTGTRRPRSSCSSKTSVSEKSDESTLDDVEDLENSDLREKINWLANGVEPWSLVELYWKATTSYRVKNNESTERGSLADYFNQFPALKQPQGFKLLLSDFEHLYPNRENRLYNSLVLAKEKILQLASDRLSSSRDRNYKLQIKELLDIATGPEGSSVSLAILLLLPFIIHLPPALKKPGKPTWKPSRSEVRDAFITQVASEGEILPTIESRKNKYAELGRTFQPLILVAGPIAQVGKSVVVVNDTLYNLSSPIEAVDAAFKIFHATNACYPEEAQDIWLFIQRAFYQITTKYDRLPQSVRSLLTNLGVENNL